MAAQGPAAHVSLRTYQVHPLRCRVMAFSWGPLKVQTSSLNLHRRPSHWLFDLGPWPGRARLVGQPAHAGGESAVQHQAAVRLGQADEVHRAPVPGGALERGRAAARRRQRRGRLAAQPRRAVPARGPADMSSAAAHGQQLLWRFPASPCNSTRLRPVHAASVVEKLTQSCSLSAVIARSTAAPHGACQWRAGMSTAAAQGQSLQLN